MLCWPGPSVGLGPLVVLTLTDVTAPASEVPVIDMNEAGRRVHTNTTALKIQRQVFQILGVMPR
ncbi:hypothetical protein PVE_P0300 (plasmid) [Pseudomonas veronii 1YdBTEX2]|uniref:Uncharacterized protein n=1 Tax=Pseudomonas veronii 1YdBTEX2 TaxID=1295141 RepID=A0A1D3KAF0_PSEVE|nr:hypothetical protein PVE_P0300 [Pseudomonas veronii 1YdBTEX2]